MKHLQQVSGELLHKGSGCTFRGIGVSKTTVLRWDFEKQVGWHAKHRGYLRRDRCNTADFVCDG